MSMRWWYFKKARAPSKPHSCDWVIWCLGYWLYGPFLEFSWDEVDSSTVDDVSKCVEAIALANNEGKSVTTFLKKNKFSHFGTPRAIISDGAPTSTTDCSRGYWRNTGFAIMWPLLTTLKLVGKLRYRIGRSNRYCPKQWMLVQQIGQGGLMMLFGPTGQLIRLP